MSDNQPLVSVILASFNEAPDMISDAINSILQQTYKNLEVLIFDDSTSKETIETINRLAADTRVKVFRFPERVGFVKSLNKGLEAAQGEFIARMDGDDFSLSIRIEKEVAFLQGNPEISIVGGNMDIMDERGTVTSHRSYPVGGIKLWMFSCYRNPLAHPTIMMRREIVDKGYRYNDSLKLSEDLDFWLRLMNVNYKLANLEDTVLRFRVQSNFAEKRTSDTQRQYMANVRKANFDKKHLVHSLLSLGAGWLYTHVSAGSIKSMYNKENKK